MSDHALSRLRDDAGDMLVSRRRGPPASSGGLVAAAATACVAAGLFGILSRRSRSKRRKTSEDEDAVAACADRLEDGALVLAGSVLLDSAVEHFRGNYRNRAMYAAPAFAAISMTAALNRAIPRPARTAMFAGAGAVGVAGLFFHAYNILKRPGGLSWNNLFYAAPAIAPGALALSGFVGYAGSHVEHFRDRRGAKRTRNEVGPALCLLTAGSILSTVAEAALLHFRGAYHDPFMYVPVVLPPVAAASLSAAAVNPSEGNLRRSRSALIATAITGVVGSAFHIFGVQRNMGGWRNWTQNLFVGPPIPAPPSFTGLAVAGLGALHLLEKQQEQQEQQKQQEKSG